MIKKKQDYKFNEKFIIDNYLRGLNFNKKNTYNFQNDASYITLNKKKKLVITSDSISENVDFFRNDDPKSIAKKITTINLSDLSAMGADPYAYSLNLFLPSYVNHDWIYKFTNELLKIQNKYNFYLLGGDLSKSNQLQISSTFFGLSKNDKIISQNKLNLNNDIWITGNLGDSYVGLQIITKKIKIKNKKIKNYFLNKYYYPNPNMLGSKISQLVESIKDISDGFIGDLNKMLANRYGAKININKIPLSINLKKIINQKLIKKKYILNSGDNYDLIIIAKSKFRKKILKIAEKFNIKITLVGKITKELDIFDDSNNTLNIPREFDHFL